jgi:hypothetical protein
MDPRQRGQSPNVDIFGILRGACRQTGCAAHLSYNILYVLTSCHANLIGLTTQKSERPQPKLAKLAFYHLHHHLQPKLAKQAYSQHHKYHMIYTIMCVTRPACCFAFFVRDDTEGSLSFYLFGASEMSQSMTN